MYQFLSKMGVSKFLLDDIDHFKKNQTINKKVIDRIPQNKIMYYGKDIWEMAITALLSGKNILLTGPKATGKNILSDNLCELFERPRWNISFHINTDADYLIGMDTFKNNQVEFRPGPVYEASIYGGFCILDEINMAKNDSVVVVHSALDYRRLIDISGYEQISLDKATRFIGTMNYGYAGTREINEALLSRFLVIDMPAVNEKALQFILNSNFDLSKEGLEKFIQLFMDLQEKSLNAEISSKCIDLRGLIASIEAMKKGLDIKKSLDMGIVNKSFDLYEKEVVKDIINSLFSDNESTATIFR